MGLTPILTKCVGIFACVTFARSLDASCLRCRSFQNARTLAQDGAAAAILALLKACPGASPQLAASLCSALRHIAVNDDICKVKALPESTRRIRPCIACRQRSCAWACLPPLLQNEAQLGSTRAGYRGRRRSDHCTVRASTSYTEAHCGRRRCRCWCCTALGISCFGGSSY